MTRVNTAGVGVMLTLAMGSYAALAAPNLGGAHAAPAVMQAAAPSATVTFSVYLPLRNQAELEGLVSQLHDKSSSKYQQWLQPADFLQRFGPSAKDLAALRTSLTSQGFTVLQSNAHGLRVQGSASAVARAFSVGMQSRSQNGRTRYMARGELNLPNELAALNARVV
jgi:subtilase family serine protease